MNIHVLCVSKGRQTKVMTKRLFPNLKLVVPHNEEDSYKEANPDVEVIGTPKSVNSLVKTRQWMLENFGTQFMVDDDITDCKRMYADSNDTASIDDPELVMQIVEMNAWMAQAIGAKMWGYQAGQHPAEYISQKPFRFTSFLNNSYMGFLDGHDLTYRTDMEEAEDHYISCLNVYKNRYMFVDRRFTFSTKDNFLSDGGCADVRNTEVMMKNTLILRRTFGEVVTSKKVTPHKKHVHKGERSISFPF